MAQDIVKYTDSAVGAVLESLNSISSIVTRANTVAEAAKSALQTISSAGGELSSANGGTVIGQVSDGVNKLINGIESIKKTLDKVSTARELMNKSAEWEDGTQGSSIGLQDIINIVESLQGMFDACAEGDMDAYIVELIDGGCDIAALGVGDPLTSYLLHNAGDGAQALATSSQYMDNYITDIAAQLERGDINVGEYLGKGLGAGISNSVFAIADATANIVGIDIPDSWGEVITDAGGVVGEGVAQVAEVVVDGVVEIGKTLWGTGKSLFKTIF